METEILFGSVILYFRKLFQKDWSGQQGQPCTMSTETALLNNQNYDIVDQGA
jgi:hypothetical protein